MGKQPDVWTIETVNQMVRYIRSDAKIANHCGCDIEYVVAARARMRPSRAQLELAKPLTPPHPEILEPQLDQWAVQARKATARLADAIARHRT